jgi:hypothetical protein
MSSNIAKDFQRVSHPTSGTQLLTRRDVPSQVARTTFDHIAVYLGPFTADAAIRACAQRVLGREPETLEQSDVPPLLAALHPMLATLLGEAKCRILLHRIERELTS